MKPTVPAVCSRYEIRTPVFHLPYILHTFAEHSVRFCLINLLNKDTRSAHKISLRFALYFLNIVSVISVQ